MEPLTLETLRTLARARGLGLSDDDLRGLLPLVEAGRGLLASLDSAALADVEPSAQYRVL
jgi:hypothetical protein